MVAAGVTELLAVLAVLEPAILCAFTVKVYAVPLVNPVITIGDVVPDFFMLPGEEITVYPKIVEPPLLVGATKDTDDSPLAIVPDTEVGAPGTEILESVGTILVTFVKSMPATAADSSESVANPVAEPAKFAKSLDLVIVYFSPR